MRLNKYLALCGLGSRRGVEQLILDGRITIDGSVVWELGVRVEEGQQIAFDGEPVVAPQQYSVWVCNKPKGYLCTREDPQGRPIIYDILPPEAQKLHYVGRLDYQSRGLLFFTDDGELSRRLTLPEFGVPRTYEVVLNKAFTEYSLQQVREGILLEDGVQLRPAKVKYQGTKLRLELKEGKNREIRRMMEHLGYRVRDLYRVDYAGFSIGSLEEGKSRSLTQEEQQELCRIVGLL